MGNITTIQISSTTKQVLNSLKDFPRETYEEIINKLIDVVAEENMELSEQTKKDIEIARKEIKAGRFYAAEDVKKRLGL
jgi:predicted S18 family serine protease